MNVEILNTFLIKLSQLEKELALQAKLNAVKVALDAVTANPPDVTQQNNLSSTLKELEDSFGILVHRLSPKEIERLDDIHASIFFNVDLAQIIQEEIAANPISPAVVRDNVAKLIGERAQYLESTKAIETNFMLLGIDQIELEEDEAEIGFQIPREIFGNNLDGFIKELGTIKFIVNTFSDVVLGKAQDIEITQLSTSDPLIFLGIDTSIIYSIGGAFTWATSQWLVVEKIRNLRAQTAELGGMPEIEKDFEGVIESSIKKGIDEKIEELIGDKETPDLVNRIEFALRAILERVERGMTIEIRMLPPPELDKNEADGELIENKEMEDLYKLRQQLVFPKASDEPILPLSSPQKEGDEAKKRPVKK